MDIVSTATGAGGGYNERDGVEYNERVESDDEYDEVSHWQRFIRGGGGGVQ